MLELVEEFPLTSTYGKIDYELKSSVTLLKVTPFVAYM